MEKLKKIGYHFMEIVCMTMIFAIGYFILIITQEGVMKNAKITEEIMSDLWLKYGSDAGLTDVEFKAHCVKVIKAPLTRRRFAA